MREMISRSRPTLSVLLGKVITTLLLAAPPAVAQPQQPAAATSSRDQSKAGDETNADPKAEEALQNGTSRDRLFYTLPDFLTVQNAGTLPPLTSWQKFKVVARSSFDYVEYPWYGALAGIGQANNSEPGFGQGAAGYAKRYGASFADGTISVWSTLVGYDTLTVVVKEFWPDIRRKLSHKPQHESRMP